MAIVPVSTAPWDGWGLVPVVAIVVVGGSPFALAAAGHHRLAPVVPGLLALSYVIEHFQTPASNDTRAVALAIAAGILAVGAAGWALGAAAHVFRQR